MWQITPHCAAPTCFSRSTNVYLCIQHPHKREGKTFLAENEMFEWIEKVNEARRCPLEASLSSFVLFWETHGDVIWYSGRKSKHAFFVDISAHINGVKQRKINLLLLPPLAVSKANEWIRFMTRKVIKLKAKCWNQISIIISLMRHKNSFDFNV